MKWSLCAACDQARSPPWTSPGAFCGRSGAHMTSTPYPRVPGTGKSFDSRARQTEDAHTRRGALPPIPTGHADALVALVVAELIRSNSTEAATTEIPTGLVLDQLDALGAAHLYQHAGRLASTRLEPAQRHPPPLFD